MTAVTLMLVGGVVSATPVHAAASSKTLCKGFSGCQDKGRSHSGYGPVHRSSFWGMQSGHNCTNYVAYRLTHGRLVARPPGVNDSGTWGTAARRAGIPVSKKPRVGSVAWWKPGYHGASRVGHVAYVEAVRSNGSIVISEDHLGGTFKWRVLKRKGKAWPSGFIRFPESDGSPAGALLWARSPGGGRIELAATSNEPDVGAGHRDYLVTVGGPVGTPGIEAFRFATPYFRFEQWATLATRGPTSVFVYALNTPGTRGANVLLGSRTVTIS